MCRVFYQKFYIWENIISSIIYKEKNSKKLYTLYTQMAESLENTGLEGCVGFILNYTQNAILKKF